MIIDRLEHAPLYYSLHKNLEEAFRYLQTTDLETIAPGKYVINGEELFAIVQEYETTDREKEQMEAHKKYMDVQYMIRGAELVGHAMLHTQTPSKPYDGENDFMLFADEPSFFTKMEAGTFMIFFPSDLHMPCIKDQESARVKKVVIKVPLSS